MKKLIFTLVGALFLFVSCQSDDLQIDEALKSDNATKVTKDMTIRSYAGEIVITLGGGDCGGPPYFEQKGGGIASHIGQYTFMNTACIGQFGLENFVGIMTAANGDEIHYGSPSIECVDQPGVFECPGDPAIFTYTIDGGTGRFEGATGTLIIKGLFVPEGPFEATGYAEIKY